MRLPTPGFAVIDADPAALAVDLRRTALLLIDMQRDFLEPGRFGAALGYDKSTLAGAIQPCCSLLDAGRSMGLLLVIQTREATGPARLTT